MAVPEKEVMHFATAAGDYEEYPNTNGTVVTSGQEKEVFYFKSERAAGTEEWEHVVELSSSCRECCYERCKGAQPFNSVEAALDHINDRTVEAHQRYSKLLKAKLDEPRPVEPKLVEPEEEVYTEEQARADAMEFRDKQGERISVLEQLLERGKTVLELEARLEAQNKQIDDTLRAAVNAFLSTDRAKKMKLPEIIELQKQIRQQDEENDRLRAEIARIKAEKAKSQSK